MTDIGLLERAFLISELFKGFSPSRHWVIKSFKRGEIVSEVQQGIGCVGLVISGSIEVANSYDGSVSIAKPGSEFGICNIFVSEKMPTTLKARVSCKVAFIPKETFAEMLAKDNAMMYRYVRLCNEKMVYLAQRLQLMSINGTEKRLWLWLLQRSEGGVVAPSIPKDELAKQLGMSRASLFRAIAKLENEGKISLAGNSFIINKEF